MSDIELRHLRYFVAVAEELHFGRAAERLHLAQPPLSQQIRKLEEIVGHPLFIRTSRAVKLTSAGESFFNQARRTLRKVEDDLEEARSIGRGEVGFLRVGFIGSSMLTRLPAMLGRYRAQFPKVNLQLREFHTSGVIEGLLESTLTLAFSATAAPSKASKSNHCFPNHSLQSFPRSIRWPDARLLPAPRCAMNPLCSSVRWQASAPTKRPFLFAKLTVTVRTLFRKRHNG